MLSERARGEAQAALNKDGEILDLMQFSQVENSKMEYESGTASIVPLRSTGIQHQHHPDTYRDTI